MKNLSDKTSRIVIYTIFIFIPSVLVHWISIEPHIIPLQLTAFVSVICILAFGWYFVVFYAAVVMMPILTIICIFSFILHPHITGFMSLWFTIAAFLLRHDSSIKHKHWKSRVCLICAFLFFSIFVLSTMVI